MKIERTVELAGSVDEVWTFIHDARYRAEWDVRVAEYQLLGPLQEGTAIKLGWRAPLSAVAAGSISRLQAPAAATFAVEGATLPIFPPGTITWQLAPTHGGTRFTSCFEADEQDCTAPGWLISFLIKRDLKRSLANLQRLLKTRQSHQPAFEAAG